MELDASSLKALVEVIAMIAVAVMGKITHTNNKITKYGRSAHTETAKSLEVMSEKITEMKVDIAVLKERTK